mgnify:CR=1 FL=1
MKVPQFLSHFLQHRASPWHMMSTCSDGGIRITDVAFKTSHAPLLCLPSPASTIALQPTKSTMMMRIRLQVSWTCVFFNLSFFWCISLSSAIPSWDCLLTVQSGFTDELWNEMMRARYSIPSPHDEAVPKSIHTKASSLAELSGLQGSPRTPLGSQRLNRSLRAEDKTRALSPPSAGQSYSSIATPSDLLRLQGHPKANDSMAMSLLRMDADFLAQFRNLGEVDVGETDETQMTDKQFDKLYIARRTGLPQRCLITAKYDSVNVTNVQIFWR